MKLRLLQSADGIMNGGSIRIEQLRNDHEFGSSLDHISHLGPLLVDASPELTRPHLQPCLQGEREVECRMVDERTRHIVRSDLVSLSEPGLDGVNEFSEYVRGMRFATGKGT